MKIPHENTYLSFMVNNFEFIFLRPTFWFNVERDRYNRFVKQDIILRYLAKALLYGRMQKPRN